MDIANKPKIKWKSGVMLFLIILGISICLFIVRVSFEEINTIIACFSRGTIVDIDMDSSCSFAKLQFVTFTLFSLLLSVVFVFSIYKTEKNIIENKRGFGRFVKFTSMLFMILFLACFGLFSFLSQNRPFLGFPYKPSAEEMLLPSILMAFFLTLAFSLIPSVIYHAFPFKRKNNS